MSNIGVFLLTLVGGFVLRILIQPLDIVSTVFSSGLILLHWFMVREMFKGQHYRFLPFVSTLFLTVSPWYILFSNQRAVNIFLFIIFAFTLFCFRYLKKYSLWLIPVFLVFATLVNFSPLSLRVNVKQDLTPIWLTDEQRREHIQNYNEVFVKVLHNKAINYGYSFLDHYGRHFNGNFLFISGDARKDQKVADFGVMYLFDILFIIFGIFGIIRKFYPWGVFLIWLAIAPLVSALNFQPPDIFRAALMAEPLILISSWGAINVFRFVNQNGTHMIRLPMTIILILIVVWDFTRFVYQLLIR